VLCPIASLPAEGLMSTVDNALTSAFMLTSGQRQALRTPSCPCENDPLPHVLVPPSTGRKFGTLPALPQISEYPVLYVFAL
jgi:hypothetical protein